ncbi:phospholipase A and acyltransferase 4-like [Antedon mediterranea]|uniref:phospholipase A and acyltransferase 4-like n=1 Tax=Antedon mediterranea TaxID=105859 RepID=UPI003AF51B72
MSYVKAGDLVIVNRTLYDHWAVYIGNGDVIHLSGAEFNIKAKETAYVHRVTFEDFVRDDDAEVECIPCPPDVSRKEVVRRAKSEEGHFFRNRKYSLVFNNCEHFARWCHGRAESKQVQNVRPLRPVVDHSVRGVGLLLGEEVFENVKAGADNMLYNTIEIIDDIVVNNPLFRMLRF